MWPASGQEILVVTGSDGTASVVYNVGQVSGARSVIAEVTDEQNEEIEYDFVIDRVEFRVNGTGTNPGTNTPRTINPYLSISLTSSNRNPGETGSLTVVAYGSDRRIQTPTCRFRSVPLALHSSHPQCVPVSPSPSRYRAVIPLSLPRALGGTYSSARATLNITSQPDRLVRVSGTGQSGAVGAQLSSDFVVRVEDRNARALNNESVTFASDCWWREGLRNKCFDKFKRGGADSTHLRKFRRHEYR